MRKPITCRTEDCHMPPQPGHDHCAGCLNAGAADDDMEETEELNPQLPATAPAISGEIIDPVEETDAITQVRKALLDTVAELRDLKPGSEGFNDALKKAAVICATGDHVIKLERFVRDYTRP